MVGVCRHARGVDVDMVVDLAERQQSPQCLRRFFVFRLFSMKQKTRQYVARNNMAKWQAEGGRAREATGYLYRRYSSGGGLIDGAACPSLVHGGK